MPIDFSKVTEAIQSRQQAQEKAAADAGTYHETKALTRPIADTADTAAHELDKIPGVKPAAEGIEAMAASSPLGAAKAAGEGDIEKVPGITGGLLRQFESPEQFKKTAQGPYGHAQEAVVAAASAAEWWGYGKIAGAIARPLSPLAAKISGPLANIMKAISNEAGIALGDEPAVAKATKIIAESPALGITAGAFETASARIEGRKPQIASNVGLGMILGAAAGLYTPEVHAQIAARMADIQANFGPGEHASMEALDNVARFYARDTKISPTEAVRRISALAAGKGSAVDKIRMEQIAKDHPEMFHDPLARIILRGPGEEAPEGSPFGVRVPDANTVTKMFESQRSDNPVDVSFKGQHPFKLGTGISAAGRAAETYPELRPGEPRTEAAKVAEPVVNEDAKDLGFEPVAIVEKGPVELTDDMIIRGPATKAGIPVASKTAEYVLPPEAVVPDAIPAAPKLKPPKMTASMTETHALAVSGDYGKLEKKLAKNQTVRKNLGRMVVHGILAPEGISSPNAARTIANTLRDLADALPSLTPAQREQYLESADDFSRRDFALRGEEPPTGIYDPDFARRAGRKTSGPVVGALTGIKEGIENVPERMRPSGGFTKKVPPEGAIGKYSKHRGIRYVREPETGDIVRTVESGKNTIDIIDKAGKTARVRKSEAPRVRKEKGAPVITSPFINIADPNELKKVEIALNPDKSPPLTQPPVAISKPIPPRIASIFEQKSPGVADMEAVFAAAKKKAAPTKFTPVPGSADFFEKALDKLRKSEKGALIFSKGTRDTSALGRFADGYGLELWKVPQGYVIRDHMGTEYPMASEAHVADFLNRFNSGLRVMREPDQVLQQSVAHLDPKSITSKPRIERGAYRKLNAAEERAARIPIADITKLAESYYKDQHIEGSEQPPTMIRRGWIKADSYLAREVIQQRSELMTMGKGGVLLANLERRYGQAYELFNRYILNRGDEIAKLLDTMTTVRQLENHTAPPEALRLKQEMLTPLFDELYSAHKAVGVPVAPRLEGVEYWPRHFDIPAEKIPDFILEQAHAMGIAGTNEELAPILNDPEKNLPSPVPQREMRNIDKDPAKARSVETWLKQQEWARKRAHAVAHNIEVERRGNEGYSDSVHASFRHWAEEASRRLAEASVFGADNKIAERAYAQIAGDSALGVERAARARAIINDVKGRVHIPMSRGIRTATNALKFNLILSGPRHAANFLWPMLHYGVTPTMWHSLMAPLHVAGYLTGLGGESVEFARQNAISIGRDALDVVDDDVEKMLASHDIDMVQNYKNHWVRQTGVDFTKMIGKAGTFGLHVMINGSRLVTELNAKNAFVRAWPKALEGNANALREISDLTNTQHTAETLRQQDPEMMMIRYTKEAADRAGGTFRPGDYPAVARSPWGAQAFRFGIFKWTLTHNIYHELFAPNVPYARRVMMAGRLLMAIPILGAINPVLRHAINAGNVNSEVAYQGMVAALNDPGDLGKDSYALIALAIDMHLLGQLSDTAQGFNLVNPLLVMKTITVDPALLTPLADIAMAGARAADGIARQDDDEIARATANMFELGGPLDVMLARSGALSALGEQVGIPISDVPPVRLSKKRTLRNITGLLPGSSQPDEEEVTPQD